MVVRVSSGLTSRCITLYHAYSLCKQNNDELVVVWPVSEDCFIHFWQVFNKDSFFGVKLKILEEKSLAIKNFPSVKGLCRDFKFLRAAFVIVQRSFYRSYVKIYRFKLTNYQKFMSSKWCVDFYPPADIPFDGVSEVYRDYNKNVKYLFSWLYFRRHNILANAYCGLVDAHTANRFKNSIADVMKFDSKYYAEVERLLPKMDNTHGGGI